MLAEEGGMLTPKDAHTRISNLEKALESLSMAIVRLSPSDDTVRTGMYQTWVVLYSMVEIVVHIY